MEPLLSVVMPSQNRADLLAQALESLCAQTLPRDRFEVVVVDDGSRDATPQVCEDFARTLPLRYHATPASGLGAAKSLAVMLSRAPIVFFFDDDDVADPKLLEEHLAVHERYPREAVAALNYTTWAPSLEVTEVMRYVTDIGQFLFAYGNLQHGQVLDYTYFWGGRSSAKRAFLMQHGLFDPDFTHSPEDIELGFRLKRHGLRVVYSRQAVSYMNRQLTFEQFCARSVGQGRSLHRFATLHPEPEVLRYADAAGARERWLAVEPELPAWIAEVAELELREKSLSEAERARLHELYGASFRAHKLKGFGSALDEAGAALDTAADEERFASAWRKRLAGRPLPTPGLRRHAADRAAGKRILVVDHYLPIYDRASGSRRLWEVMKLLVAAGHSVTFVARDGKHGRRYVEELQALGIEVVVRQNTDPQGFKPDRVDVPTLLRERDFDLAYLSFFIVAQEWTPMLRALSPRTRVIVDTVDLHWVRERREAELKQDPALFKRADEIYRQELAAYRDADALVVVTEKERAVLLGELPEARVHVIPNVHGEAPVPAPLADRDGLLFVGYFGHRPNADGIEWFAREVLPLVRAQLPDVKLTIVGPEPTDEVRALAADGVEVTGWVESTEPYLQSHRVSIAPLRFGAGLKGKVGEALAAGLPVVTTSVGVEGMPSGADGGALLVADDARAFADAVVRLHRDDELWQRFSAAGRALVAETYGPAALAPSVEGILAEESLTAPEPDASIVILVRDQLELTRACLESIETHTPERHELILVDNGSQEETAGFLRSYVERHDHVRLVANVGNRGFAAGNNLGLALAGGRAVVFLNNDTVVTEGWLRRMLDVLEREPDTGLVGPLTNRASGPQVVSDVPYARPEEANAFAGELARRHAGRTLEVDRLVGFCLLARREVIQRLGGFDPRFGAGNLEDDDLCVRARAAGFGLRIAADAFVHHVGNSTFKSAGVDYHQSMLRNWALFKEKWSIPPSTGMGEEVEISDEALAAASLYQPLPALELEHELLLHGRYWKEVPVHRAYLAALETLSGGDPDSLRRTFAEIAQWQDVHRRYQLRKQLIELTLATDDRREAQWVNAFVTTLDELLAILEEQPAEPVLLNYAGVLLYELAEIGGAETLFKAAKRLDPNLPQIDDNLAAVHRLKGARLAAPRGANAAQVRELGARAARIAAAAKEAGGLTLSLCMIVKNEEELLPGCLAAARDAVDEIVVVDTGSSDRTVEIAESFGAKVVHFPWNGSFADARNVSIEHATGDWVMYLDADEHLTEGSAEKIRALLGRTWREAFHLVEVNYTGGEGSGEAVTHLALRLWRNRPEYRFKGRIHEQKTHAMPHYLPERFEVTDVRMVHYGYLKSRIVAKEKSQRNIELLEQEMAERGLTAYGAFNLGSEHVIAGDVAKARQYLEQSWQLVQRQPNWQGEPWMPMLFARLATLRREAGELDATRELVERGLELYPDHTDLVFKLALCAIDEKDWPAAEQYVCRCLELGDSPPAYSGTVGSGTYLARSLLGQICEVQGRLDEAEQAYRQALADNPDFAAVVLPLAGVMFRRGAAPAEVEALVPTGRPGSLLLAASACYEAGHTAEAAAWFERVLDSQPDNVAARVGIVEALLAEKRYDEALAHTQVRVDGAKPDGRLALAELFLHALRGDAAALAAALADAPVADGERALFSAWQAALAGAELPAALDAAALAPAATFLEALLKVQEFSAFETLHGVYSRIAVSPATRSELLAAIYFRRGFLDSAADEWVASLQAEPAAGPLLGLAHVAVARGLQEDALVFCDEALALEPSSAEASSLRDALLARAA